MAVYVASVTGLLALGRATGRELPEHYSLRDLTLGGIATHKLTRLLSRSSVTSPLRAPFTQFEQAAGSGEHLEKPRDGHGLRHTVGGAADLPVLPLGSGWARRTSPGWPSLPGRPAPRRRC